MGARPPSRTCRRRQSRAVRMCWPSAATRHRTALPGEEAARSQFDRSSWRPIGLIGGHRVAAAFFAHKTDVEGLANKLGRAGILIGVSDCVIEGPVLLAVPKTGRYAGALSNRVPTR